MKNKYKTLSILFAVFLLVLIVNNIFSEVVEISVLAPVNVNLNSGWPTDKGNRVIGVLPKGSLVRAKPLIIDDHMVYEIEFMSAAKKRPGFIMFDGYCGSSIIEVRVRRNLFGADKKKSIDCERAR